MAERRSQGEKPKKPFQGKLNKDKEIRKEFRDVPHKVNRKRQLTAQRGFAESLFEYRPRGTGEKFASEDRKAPEPKERLAGKYM